MSRQEGSLG
jgi:hypothetical protein